MSFKNPVAKLGNLSPTIKGHIGKMKPAARIKVELKSQEKVCMEMSDFLDQLADVPAPTPEQIQKLMTVQALMMRDIGVMLVEKSMGDGVRINHKEMKFGMEFMKESRLAFSDIAKAQQGLLKLVTKEGE